MTKRGKALIWGIFGTVILFVVLFLTEARKYRIKHPAYATGTIIGMGTIGRGFQVYLDYSFVVDTKTYSGSVPKEDCPDCKTGSHVKVRYAEGNPANSDLGK